MDTLADFLRYLLDCAATYIQDTHPNGPDLWNTLKEDIDLVVSVGNGRNRVKCEKRPGTQALEIDYFDKSTKPGFRKSHGPAIYQIWIHMG